MGLRSGVEDAQVFKAVTGQLGIGRDRLGLGASFADDQLVIAQVDRLVLTQVEEGSSPHDRDRVLALVRLVEVGHQARPLVRDRRLGGDAGRAKACDSRIHGWFRYPPTCTGRPELRRMSAAWARASTERGTTTSEGCGWPSRFAYAGRFYDKARG